MSATLLVGDDLYRWSADQMRVCYVDQNFPANGEFREAPPGDEGDWFQFLDRGDGGINFSAVLGGERYAGTGGGEADEIRADGFTYTGTLNRGGEIFDVELAVSC